MNPRTVAVVGGGISGISAAVALTRRGHHVTLFESDDRLGGRIGPSYLGDRSIMLGGKNIGHRYTRLRALLADLEGGTLEEFGINTSTLRGGRLLPLDSSRPLTSLRSLLQMGTPRDLVRLALLSRAVRNREDARFLGSPTFRRIAKRYGDPVLTDHFSPRLTATLLRLATVRMNGAEPDEAYLGTLGTNLGLLTDTFEQLDHGFAPALARVPATIDVQLGARVIGLHPHSTGLEVQYKTSSSSHTHSVDGVILALPAHAAAPLLEPRRPELARLLRSVRYFPATVAVVKYADDVFTSKIRAVAMDQGPCSNAGAYGSTDLDLVRYTFSGRRGRLDAPTQADIDSLMFLAEASLSDALGRPLPERLEWTWQHWPAAYCAYSQHHARLLDNIATETHPLAGRISLAGDYLLGASLEACCRSGEAASNALLRPIQNRVLANEKPARRSRRGSPPRQQGL